MVTNKPLWLRAQVCRSGGGRRAGRLLRYVTACTRQRAMPSMRLIWYLLEGEIQPLHGHGVDNLPAVVAESGGGESGAQHGGGWPRRPEQKGDSATLAQ